jgi:hypothetical protein
MAMQAQALYPSSMYQDHMFLGAAMLFWVHTGVDNAVAAVYFQQAMSQYQASKALRDRCGIPLVNWDTPCAHAMLLLVQGSGHYDSWFSVRLRDFAEQHVGFENDLKTEMVGANGLKCAHSSMWDHSRWIKNKI